MGPTRLGSLRKLLIDPKPGFDEKIASGSQPWIQLKEITGWTPYPSWSMERMFSMTIRN